MFVVARTSANRIGEVKAYLYGGQSIVSEPVNSLYGTFVIVESAHGLAGKMLVDRLGSGMIGAKEFETRAEAEAYIESETAD